MIACRQRAIANPITIMITSLLAAVAFSGLLGLLLKIAIFAIIAWAIVALLAWAGWVIPRPIQIILIALGSILVIYWLFEAFALFA